MTREIDLLDAVVARLEASVGELPRIARETGISYDTLLRIKNRENDTGYSKVKQLATFFGISLVVVQPTAAAGRASAQP